MTCNGCRTHVEEALNELNSVQKATVNLEKEQAIILFDEDVSLESMQQAVGSKYTISAKPNSVEDKQVTSKTKKNQEATTVEEDSKWKQLKPLFLIFFYITAAAVLLHYNQLQWQSIMLDFMGLFYIVFSFFKFLDYKGFPSSFRMYDPLAKQIPAYAWVYPFIETALGLCFLFRFQVQFALIATLVILGITTIGVSQSLFLKRKIKCACLGTALNLPMTEATFIENTIMIAMAVAMLIF